MLLFKAIILFFTFLLVGCKTFDIIGDYQQTSNWEFNTVLKIDQGKTYLYKQRLGNVWIISSGQWEKIGDTLKLKDTLTATIEELKQQEYLIKGDKLIEIAGNDQKNITLRKSRK